MIDAEGFRNAVLAQRQRVIDNESGARATVATAPPSAGVSSDALLSEIRDMLARIESKLALGDNE